MTRDPDPIGFDDIVAAWRAEGGVPEWPAEDGRSAQVAEDDDRPRRERRPVVEQPPDAHPPTGDDRPATGPRAPDPAAPPEPPVPAAPDAFAPDPRAPNPLAPDPLAEEHFVPPEPPPVPRIGPPMLVGLTLIGLGLVLVTFPGWVGVPQVYGLPLGLVAIAAGLGWLVLRLWPDNDDGTLPPLYLDDPDDPDGGAVL